jgi:hypothetical protein
VFSQLKNGQSSYSSAGQDHVALQELGKTQMQQVYVPKKVEVPIVSLLRARPQSVITISSTEAPVTNHDGPIVIEEIPAPKQEALKQVVTPSVLSHKTTH